MSWLDGQKKSPVGKPLSRATITFTWCRKQGQILSLLYVQELHTVFNGIRFTVNKLCLVSEHLSYKN